MTGEFVYIFYSYVFGLYNVLLTSMTAKHNHKCHKMTAFVYFYYVQIHISQICILWTEIQGSHLTQLM